MTKETYFEELSYALRRRELLPRPLEEDGLLPVEWNGRILCRVTESGAVRYDPTWVDTSRAKAALAQATEAAGTVMEYMTLLENAPPLRRMAWRTVTGCWQSSTAQCWPGQRRCWGPSSSPGPGTMTGAGSTTATTTWRTIRAPGRTSPSAPAWWPGNGSLTRSRWRGCARRCRASSMERAPPPTSRQFQCRRLLDQITAQLPERTQDQMQSESQKLGQSM